MIIIFVCLTIQLTRLKEKLKRHELRSKSIVQPIINNNRSVFSNIPHTNRFYRMSRVVGKEKF